MQDFRIGIQLFQRRGVPVNGPFVIRFNGTQLIDGLADEIHDPSQCSLANRHSNGIAGVHHFMATLQSIGRVHGHTSGGVFSKMLRHL